MRRYLGVLVAASAIVVGACGGKSEAENEPVAAAEAPAATLGASDLAVAVSTTLKAGVPLSGALEPKVTVTLSAPFAEQLATMLVDEGDVVREGQPLARFRDDVPRAAAASAQADAAQARVGVQVALADSTRAEALFAEGATARRDRDNALFGLQQARAREALAQTQLTQAQERLDNATLRSPVTGVVSVRHAQAGDRVDFGKSVITIVDNRVLQLEASVEARWLGALRVGRVVALTVSGMPHDTIAGRIARINPLADAATRQVRLYVEVPSAGRLVGGLYVSGIAFTDQVPNAVAIPKAAVRVEGTNRESVVYVVTGGRVARRVVATGVEDAERGLLQVRSGVAAGDSVVIGPVDGLSDGGRVDVGTRRN